MELLFQISIQIIFPVFLLLFVGAWLHRIFHFHLSTLSKMLTYIFLPAVIFSNIYQTEIEGSLLLQVGGFLALQLVILAIIAHIVAKILKMDRKLTSTFKNSLVLNNSGNFGLPVSQLVFQSNPIGASIQIIVMMFQNIVTYTYGLMNAASAKQADLSALKEFFKTPILYALILGFMFNRFDISIPSFLWSPLENAANAFLAFALLTLGAQVAYPALKNFTFIFYLSVLGRLVFSPILALAILLILGMDGTIAQALFIASSFPMSRNSALFALIYDNYPDYAGQGVLISTLLSSITVTIVVYLAEVIF